MNGSRFGVALALALGLGLAALVPGHSHAQAAKPKVSIALVTDGSAADDGLIATLMQEVSQVLSSEHEVHFLPTFEADWSLAGAKQQLEAALSHPEARAIIAVGLYVSMAAAERETLPKPVVLPLAAPSLQNLPVAEGKSGRTNLTYVSGLLTLERDLRRLKDIVAYDHVALLLDSRVVQALPALPEAVKAASEQVQVRASIVSCEDQAASILEAVPADARVVYLTHLPRLPMEQRKKLIDGLTAQKRVVFSMHGPDDVALGAFASLASPKENLRRARRVALLLERILRGEDPATMSVTFESAEQLTLNRRVAQALDVTPRPEVLIEAKLEGEKVPTGGSGKLELRSAVQRAMDNNLDVGVQERSREAREQGVKRARGGWLPQLDVRAGFDWIDPDIASAFGPAERTLGWGVDGSQVLYSRRNFAELGTEKQRLAASDADLSTSRLEAGTFAATTYLDVERARILQRVNEENLDRTRANLSLAEARVAVGAAGRDEVYRWQAEVAQRRRDVLVAMADFRRAVVRLNRVLNEPLSRSWNLGEVTIPDVVLVLPENEQFLLSAEGFDAMRGFMIERAMANSPELKSLDASIEGQRVVVEASRQSFFAPTVSAVGGFTHLPGTWGAGADDTPPIAGVPVPPRDEFSWKVGVHAELPLFAGNARTATLREQSRELARLQTQRAATAQEIEQRVQDSFLKLTATYPAVALARQAAEAAGKNLEVITDKYRRGATDIIRLIDAQNQALLADLAQASAVYDFLTDYVEAERSTGTLMFMESVQQRTAIVRGLTQRATSPD